MSFANQLIELTDIQCREIENTPTMRGLLSGDISENQYVKFMADIYPVVLHFCPIMAAAAGRCAEKYDVVRLYLYDHIHEEKGHEKIVLKDIASFGYASTSITEKPPREAIQAMIAFNYFSALMGNPCNVLGMIYVLEIISSVYAGKAASAVSNALGRNLSEGFIFLQSHSSADMEHMTKLRHLFQSIESPEIFADLMNSVKMNFYLFCQVLKQEN
jgi:pyrroloquinoline quinone (PQQ) biosynthesis protein C